MILLGTVGLLLLVGSEELLMIFIGLELTGLSLYILTAFDKKERASAEAGMKYFLFGSMASAVTLFGLSLVYGLTGRRRWAISRNGSTAQPTEPLLAAGIIMTLIGFAFKVAARALPSLGAGCVPGRASFDGGLRRLGIEGGILRCAGEKSS
jgi:NADH-quinone oxidoreductase subunit N